MFHFIIPFHTQKKKWKGKTASLGNIDKFLKIQKMSCGMSSVCLGDESTRHMDGKVKDN